MGSQAWLWEARVSGPDFRGRKPGESGWGLGVGLRGVWTSWSTAVAGGGDFTSSRWALDHPDPDPDGRNARQRAPRAGPVGFPPRLGEHTLPGPHGGSDSATEVASWSLETASPPSVMDVLKV